MKKPKKRAKEEKEEKTNTQNVMKSKWYPADDGRAHIIPGT